MITIEFLIASLVVILIPGSGVLYTISIGIFKNKMSSFYAALGCTVGILPHIVLSILMITFLFSVSDILFIVIKYLGITYLLYLALLLWNNKGIMKLSDDNNRNSTEIFMKGILINILNPKLTVFLVSFLPQFINKSSPNAVIDIFVLSSVFMIMTLIVFIIYGISAGHLIKHILTTNKSVIVLQRILSITFVLLCVLLIC